MPAPIKIIPRPTPVVVVPAEALVPVPQSIKVEPSPKMEVVAGMLNGYVVVIGNTVLLAALCGQEMMLPALRPLMGPARGGQLVCAHRDSTCPRC